MSNHVWCPVEDPYVSWTHTTICSAFIKKRKSHTHCGLLFIWQRNGSDSETAQTNRFCLNFLPSFSAVRKHLCSSRCSGDIRDARSSFFSSQTHCWGITARVVLYLRIPPCHVASTANVHQERPGSRRQTSVEIILILCSFQIFSCFYLAWLLYLSFITRVFSLYYVWVLYPYVMTCVVLHMSTAIKYNALYRSDLNQVWYYTAQLEIVY